ncbi:hypothetical protein LTS18_005356 [Coniosporium uncinatum]|uniref:Uncharacterized protein n=1 Tax=Coniosporium uncinatum TaxID=93489 RepID=A0ACC3D4P0_9PEZI|nr:hypothetical protein LTS18_005356 [Coniosporium uncinatum]
MRAVQFAEKGPIQDVLKVVDIPKPTAGEDELLVRILASGINPADAKNIEGSILTTILPRVPNRDFSGIVESGPHAGLEVWGTGGESGTTTEGAAAEYIVVKDADLAPKPKNLSFVQAAACGVPFLTASAMLRRAGVRAGQYVLVLGSSGSVGSAAVALCKFLQAAPLKSGRHGTVGEVDSTATQLVTQTRTLTNGADVDGVLDTVSDPALFQKALITLKKCGT